MGTSMGGYIVIRYAVEKGDAFEFDGVVSLAPALQNAF